MTLAAIIGLAIVLALAAQLFIVVYYTAALMVHAVVAAVAWIAPYQCRNCKRPAWSRHDYCPGCSYSTVEPTTRDAGGDDRA